MAGLPAGDVLGVCVVDCVPVDGEGLIAVVRVALSIPV